MIRWPHQSSGFCKQIKHGEKLPWDFTVFVPVPFISVVVVFLIPFLPFFLFFLPAVAFGVAFVFLGLTRFPDTLVVGAVGAKRKDDWEGWDDASVSLGAASATSVFTNATACGSDPFVVVGPAFGFGATWQSQEV